jgi:hypothetical protein
MKKLMLLLVIVLFSVILAKSQTFQDVKSENSTELQSLQKKLDDVKDRRYYLEVTLPERIKKGGVLYDNENTRKELHFAPEEIISLKAKQAKIEAAITALEESSYQVDEVRTRKGSPSNLPEKMTAREYRRRNRTQAFSSLDTFGAIMNEKKELKGMLINNKLGTGENAYFYFERTDIKEAIHHPKEMVEPNSKKIIYLPMGNYRCVVTCNGFSRAGVIISDPRTKTTVKGVNGDEEVHFWAIQNL